MRPANFSSGTTQDMTSSVTWSTSNPAVASIDASGKARGLALGSATVRAVDPATGIASTSGGVIAVVGAPADAQDLAGKRHRRAGR